nr:hypothetical protein CFP56_76032 [Quercus suber]
MLGAKATKDIPAPAQNSATRFVFAKFGADKGGKRSLACSECRRRKKRCIHWSEGSDESNSGQVHGQDAPDASDRRETQNSPVRFIGCLNPESELRQPENRRTTSGTATPHGRVGLWHTDPAFASHVDRSYGHLSSMLAMSAPLARRVVMPLMEDQSVGCLPPAMHLSALERYFFNDIHLILPLINKDAYEREAGNTAAHTLLAQGICLLASSNISLSQHLRLPEIQDPLSPRDFGLKIYGAMRITIELGMVRDKMTVIRASLMMSMFGGYPADIDLPAHAFSRAVNLAYSIGLHHCQVASRMVKDHVDLFCCLWCIDRLNAAVHGRPVILHEVDLAKSPKDCLPQLVPAFRVFVSISVLLDHVIALYRPNTQDTALLDEEFPGFQEILGSCDALCLPDHITGILSCRTDTQSSSNIPFTHSMRQRACVTTIHEIINSRPSTELVMLPFVPYSASLALSAAHRELRHSKSPTLETRARARVVQSLNDLNKFGPVSWSASAIAELASSVLREPTSRTDIYPAIPTYAVATTHRDTTVAISTNTGESASSTIQGDARNATGQAPDASSYTDIADILALEWTQAEIDKCLEGFLDLDHAAYLQKFHVRAERAEN